MYFKHASNLSLKFYILKSTKIDLVINNYDHLIIRKELIKPFASPK
jgi:hypothetical protein